MHRTPIKIFILFLFGYIMYLGSPASVRSQEINNPVNNQEESEPVSDKAELPPSPDGFCGLTSVDCSNAVSNQAVVRPADSEKIKILKEVCDKKGMPKYCYATLYAMHLTETRGDCQSIGDQGKSYGCFQIQVKMHNVTKECAYDFKCSSEWTLNNLIAHQYPTFASQAIRKHNGTGPGTIAYLATVNKFKSNIK